MKYILTAALALTLLSGTAAIAEPGNSDNNGHGDKHENNDHDRKDQGNRDHGGNDQSRYNQGSNDQSRNNQGQNNQGQNDQGQNDQGRYDQGRDHDHNRNDHGDNGDRGNYYNGPSNPRNWSRGDRLPEQYRQRPYYVNDWRQYGLRQPPRGYHWIRNDNNDFYLTVIETGVIGDTMYRGDRDDRWRHRYARTYTYNDDNYYRECRNSPDPGGVIAGAVIGGLLGNAAGHRGDRGASTLAGVIVGGAVGGVLTSNLNCEDRSYAYRSYYDGFNAGRPYTTYRWNNPENDNRGEFRIRNYYNDRDGFRCANYKQVIYVNGRPQGTSGRACRQPDGDWAIIN